MPLLTSFCLSCSPVSFLTCASTQWCCAVCQEIMQMYYCSTRIMNFVFKYVDEIMKSSKQFIFIIVFINIRLNIIPVKEWTLSIVKGWTKVEKCVHGICKGPLGTLDLAMRPESAMLGTSLFWFISSITAVYWCHAVGERARSQEVKVKYEWNLQMFLLCLLYIIYRIYCAFL